MKAFLVKLKLVFLFILFSSGISLASEISPEAEKLLDRLHAKTADIKSLSWEIESKPLFYTTNCYYKQGGFFRLQMEYSHNDYQLDYLIIPEKSLSYNTSMGEITDGIGMYHFSSSWFLLPLLDKNTLKNWGDVTVKKESIKNEDYLVLEMSFKATPQTRSGSNWKHRFYFDTEELKLEKVEYSYGHGSTQILKVKEYKKIGEYDFPLRIEGTYGSLSITNIQINPDLSEDLFKLEEENTLTCFSNYSEEEVNSTLSKNPNDPNLHYTLAKLFHYQKRELPKAIQEYKKAIILKPNARAAYFGLASAYQNSKQYDKAIELYEELIAKFPEDKQNYLSSLMWAYQRADRNEDAIKTAEEYLKEKPDKAHVYSTTASLYNNLKDYDKAIQMYKKAIELEENADNQARHLMQIGRIYAQQKKYEEAEGAYEEAKTTSKRGWVQQDANRQISELYRKMGKIDELVKKYEAKLKEEPENIQLLKQLAEIYSGDRQYEKCIELYSKALEIEPDDRNILSQLASAYQNSKQYDKAIELYEELIAKFPEDKQNYLSSLMWAYQRADRNEDAIKTAEEYLKEKPDKAHVYSTTASLYNNLKDYDKAIQMYKKAIEMEENADNQAQHLMQIGRIYSQQKKYEEAEKAYEEAKTKSKRDWVQQNANRQITELYRKMISKIEIESSLIQKELDSLIPTYNNIKMEMDTRIAKAVAYRKDNPSRSSYIVIGRLVLDGTGNVQSDVKTQMDILPSGYFVALAKDPSRPLSFRMHGYKPLDADLNAIIKQPFANIGILHLSPLLSEEKASLTGKMILEGNGDGSNTKIEVDFRQLLNTPGNFSSSSYGRYENLNYNQTSIHVGVDADDTFRSEGFSPTEYTIVISAPGYVRQRISVNLQPGEKLDLGTIFLELPKKMYLSCISSDVPQKKRSIFLAPDERWKPISEGYWNLTFKQKTGKIKLRSSHGPWYATDMGAGTLDDFKDIQNTNTKIERGYGLGEIKNGHVYFVKRHGEHEESWVIFKINIY